MKEPTGALVEPFDFSDKRRNALLDTFPDRRNPDRRTKHEEFIEITRSIFETWRSLTAESVVAKEARARAERIRRYARLLGREINGLRDLPASMLTGGILKALYVGGDEAEFAELRRTLTGVIGEHGEKIENDLYQLMLGLLRLLETASQSLEVKSKPGPNREDEKLLIRWLASAWHQHFGEFPSHSPGTTFSDFVMMLSDSELDGRSTSLGPECRIDADMIYETVRLLEVSE